MEPNFLILLAAAVIPMIIGFIWYNPAVAGKAWMEAAGMTEEKIKGGNMPLIFGLSFVLALMLSFGVYVLVVHQTHLASLTFNNPDDLPALMEQFKTAHRSFGHGVFHGVIDSILIAIPILTTNALFERKGFKYIWVNGLYWIITIALMGGVICAWA